MQRRTRIPRRATPAVGWLLAAIGLAAGAPAGASVHGTLANFDVVNDSGHDAWGFEIEIEDDRYDRPGMITSVFGLDRVFGWISPDPGAVVRFGKPTVEYLPGFGARITYGGKVGGVATPSAPFSTTGESCWPGANANWKATSCDHFGVSTYGSPLRTNYSWLLDDGAGGITKLPAKVPAPIIQIQPPVPNQPPPPPRMILPAPDPVPGAGPEDNAYWVNVIKTELKDNVDLNDLLAGNHPGARPEIAALEEETEFEWQPLQLGMVDEVSKVIDAPSPSVVYKFQFFTYQGRYDDDGFVDPIRNQFPQIDANGTAFVMIGGQRHDLVFVGQQIAGFNAAEVAAVPEPASAVLMLGGLAGLAGFVRRRRAPAGAAA